MRRLTQYLNRSVAVQYILQISEYMKGRVSELRRKVSSHDWSSQLNTLEKEFGL